MKLLKLAIKILSLIIVVSVILTAMFFRDNSVTKLDFNSDVFLSPVSTQLHTEQKEDFELVCMSGFIELYFNKKTSGIAVREVSRDHWWYAMPDGAQSSMITMEALGEKGLYKLNSQDNSVAFSQWRYDLQENGVNIVYSISAQEVKSYSEDDIAFEVMLSIVLKDGSLFADCQVRKLTENEKCAVSSLSILPGLCSFKNPGKKDFLLIPDGCGAVIYPALCEKTETYDVKVYGDDFSVKNENSVNAIMGAFGVKAGENAIAVIIDSGEEIATVKAVSDKNSFSGVYADFEIYNYSVDKKICLSQKPFSDSVSLCYKFLSGDNASYSEIASSCREQFIRNGSLPSADATAEENVPLYLTVTGKYKADAWRLGDVKYTTFAQALDILTRIKAKGVDNITVRYAGALKRDSAKFSSSLGSKKDIEDLLSYAFSQNISLFIDADIHSYQSFFGKFDFSAVKGMNKSASSVIINTAPDGKADNTVKLRFRKEADIGDFVDDLLMLSEDYNFTGYCIGDGEMLVSDYSSDNVSRSDMKKSLSSQIPALSNTGKVMIDKGNMYLVKNASGIINIPMTTSYAESDSYVAIPFVQSVLHGRITISGEAINIQGDIKDATLQCIEYGVCPSFTTVYSDKNLDSDVLFDNLVNEIMDCYDIASDALFGLESERITAHDCVKDGVYLTTYGDTAMIYVNYNETAASVNGVTIPAKSYLRID